MQDVLHPPEWVLRCSPLWLEFTKLKEGCSKQGPENHLPEKPSQITDTDRCTHLFGLPPSFLFSSTGSKYQRKPPRKRIFASPSMFCTWGVAAPPPTALLFFFQQIASNTNRRVHTSSWPGPPPTPPTPSFCNSSPKRHSVSFFQMGICLRNGIQFRFFRWGSAFAVPRSPMKSRMATHSIKTYRTQLHVCIFVHGRSPNIGFMYSCCQTPPTHF